METEEWLRRLALRPGGGQELAACRALLERQGLALSPQEAEQLALAHARALRDTGRVEFGEGILPRLVRTFAASPYLTQDNCGEVLAQLQALFYEFKNATELPDGELLDAMEQLLDGRAAGAPELLEAVSPETLRRLAAGKGEEEDGEGEADDGG